jgi:hypothetical protein
MEFCSRNLSSPAPLLPEFQHNSTARFIKHLESGGGGIAQDILPARREDLFVRSKCTTARGRHNYNERLRTQLETGGGGGSMTSYLRGGSGSPRVRGPLRPFEEDFFSLHHYHQRSTIAWSTRRTATSKGSSKKEGGICNNKER